MGHTDKEVLQKARELVATGLDQRKAIIDTLHAEGLDLEKGRRSYLWNFLTRKLREDARRNSKKEAVHPAQTVTLPPVPASLSYKVCDDGKFIIVKFGRFTYQFKPTRSEMLFRDFHSETRGETLANTSSDMHYSAKLEALTYFRGLPTERRSQLLYSR